MKPRSLGSLFSAAALLCGAVTIEAAEDIPSSAFALADAMQVVETFRLVVEARTKAGIETGRNSAQELRCWKVADFTPARSLYAEAFARLLTSAEMDEATAFLATPLGSKFVPYVNAEGMKRRGWPWAAAPSLTEEEAAAGLEFLSTSAGSKIYSEEFQSAHLRRMIDRFLPMLEQCAEPKSLARHFEDLEASMTPEERERAAASAADTTRPSQSDAIKLVRAMREDEYFLAILRQRMNADTRPVTKARRACIEGLQPTDITGAMAIAVQDQLSAVEVADAIAFYQSEAGRKFAGIMFDYIEGPVELADILKVMSAEEVLSLRKFFVLSAARKLMQDKIIQQPASLSRVGQRIRELTDSCLSETGGKR